MVTGGVLESRTADNGLEMEMVTVYVGGKKAKYRQRSNKSKREVSRNLIR